MSVYEFFAQLMEDILYPPFTKIRQAIAAEPRPDKNKEAINRAISFQCDHFVTSDQATKLGGPVSIMPSTIRVTTPSSRTRVTECIRFTIAPYPVTARAEHSLPPFYLCTPARTVRPSRGASGSLATRRRASAAIDRRSLQHSVRDNADVLPCRARAGQCFAGCELYFATVWKFDIAPDKWSATFKHILSANRKARWQARVAGHR